MTVKHLKSKQCFILRTSYMVDGVVKDVRIFDLSSFGSDCNTKALFG